MVAAVASQAFCLLSAFIFPVFPFIHMFHGPLAAAYCATMLGLRANLWATVSTAVAAALGLSHMCWIIPLAGALVKPLATIGVPNADGSAMLLGTTCVFCVLIGVGTRSFQATATVLLSGMLACVLLLVPASRFVGFDGGLAVGIGVLHLGNIVALAWANEKFLSEHDSEQVCRKCRYDLTGLTTTICPECGSSITPKPDTSSADAPTHDPP